MAKKALINKQQKQPSTGCAPTRAARSAGVPGPYERFMLCRICFRQLAHAGELPGVTKSSW